MSNELAILVLSCDKFRPVWHVFYALLFRYWPESCGHVYHYSESLEPKIDGVTPILSGLGNNPKNWSDGLLCALDRIDAPYVILMLEDFFLSSPVKSGKITEIFRIMLSDPNIGCFRLVPIPGADVPVDAETGKISPRAPYRISTQVALWEKEFLKSMVRSGESPWEFEHQGTVRSRAGDREIWAVMPAPPADRIMTHVNGIIRGKLTGEAVKLLVREGLPLPENFPVNTPVEDFYWQTAPPALRKLMDFVNHRLYPFLWKGRT